MGISFVETSPSFKIIYNDIIKIMEEIKTMKLNPKIYKQLTGEPFETQVVNGKTVEFHLMDGTPFLFQYASRGRFAVWTSDGVNYKVLIESTYFQSLKNFYEPEINEIWLGFLTRVSQISKKMNLIFIVPTILLYIGVAALATAYFPNQMWPILVSLIALVVISNVFQSKIMNRRVQRENQETQNIIRQKMGVENFDQLVVAQEEHYKKYFNFEVEPDENQNSEDSK
jgi:hypothetical protein